jgi:hypothetical protein
MNTDPVAEIAIKIASDVLILAFLLRTEWLRTHLYFSNRGIRRG